MSSDNKTLMVLGATSQVGTALIRRIQGGYGRILAHYNSNIERINELAGEFGDKIIPVQADLNSTGSARAMADHIKANGLLPDHFVHLACPRCRNERFHKCRTDDFLKMYNCSVISGIEILKPIAEAMSKNKKGKIVIMLTAYTANDPPAYLSPYVSAKYALLGLMKALAAEYRSKGICVNAVSPEMINTDFISDIPELAVAQAVEQSVMGRLLEVDEVIPTFEYLLSEAADRITGQNIIISGVK